MIERLIMKSEVIEAEDGGGLRIDVEIRSDRKWIDRKL